LFDVAGGDGTNGDAKRGAGEAANGLRAEVGATVIGGKRRQGFSPLA
jgi:hypothetical protein